ncbi:MAG: 1-acyl-sn-glycerol-3-phosphate acyltransferase [Bacteroidetes bacterium]|nr:1-acyl-sn-glycerol-3-phosphate acyltransferase [Bacteroidota bacterium]HET6244631.1 1-acyl-sn-glycerol-3-phosphate acyltransferase [Bacteroidia bacterium]
MSNLFIALYEFFEHKKFLLFFVFACIVSSLMFFASKIQLQENIMQMLPKDKDSEQLASFLENSKFSDRIMVCITKKDTLSPALPDSMVELADVFADRLNEELAEYIESVNYTADDNDVSDLLEVIDNNLPLFLDDKDYLKIDSIISSEGIREKVKYNYQTLTGPAGIGLKKFILNDPLGLNFLAYKKLNSFQADEQFELYDQHFVTKDRYSLFLFINPKFPSSETGKNAEFFIKMDQLISKVITPESEFELVYFGAPVVASGNAKQIRTDTILTVSITIILLVLMVVLFFRKLSAPLLMLIPVVFGALFALACIYLIKGNISVISLGAGSLVLGIAVNYSLHFLTHFHHHPDPKVVIKELSFPMTIGSLTTIGGFLCLQFVKAPVLRDLGLFAAFSLMGAALASLLFLPHFLKEKTVDTHAEISDNSLFQTLLSKIQGNKLLVCMFLGLTPLFLYFAKDVQFETDMYKINYMSSQVKHAENKVNSISSYYQKSVFVITKGKSLDQALIENEKTLPVLEKLKEKGKIKSYVNVSALLPSKQEQLKRIKKWENYWSAEKGNTVYNAMVKQGAEFQFKESAFIPFKTLTNKKFNLLSSGDEKVLKDAFLNNFIEEKNGHFSLIGLVKTTPEQVSEIYDNLSFLPDVIVFDRQYVTDKLMDLVSEDFNFITLWTSLLVFLALLLVYGRIELALVTFIPMVVSWIWILGIMALLGIKFNIVNIVLSTLVFALGDDYCIFTTDGLQQEYARKVKNIKSITTSISLSAITTIVGLGVLVFARHPALNSIALVSIIGILCVWIVSQTLQPVLFNALITKPTNKKHEPYTFFNIIKSIFAFGFFVFGSLFLGVFGFLLFNLIPIKKAVKKHFYHKMLSGYARALIYMMINVNKQVINDYKENFSKPAVVIANHSSFLDILLLVMLHPKLILVTNKWVWNSPVFGLAVRMADYYPVAEGAENTIAKFSERINEGYSIVIFPEGTRSVHGNIGRFHKGAFFLAQELQLDILPIVIHGANYAMTKGHFYLKNSKLTLKVLPRIKPGDLTFGANYSERAKLIGRYFRQQYAELSADIETTTYFKGMLFSNYLYKGPILEWYMRVKVGLEKNYELFDRLLPKQGKILDIGCGYGFMAYMLGYRSSQRIVKGIDYDGNKIEIAQNGYLKGKNVSFAQGNALEFKFERYDAIVLSDVLHYLKTEDQIVLLENCIENVSEGGMLLIRDGVKELEKRHKGTKLTELFSTRILGFNKTGENGLTFLSSQLIHDMAAKHSLELSLIDNSKFTSNVVFVLKKIA